MSTENKIIEKKGKKNWMKKAFGKNKGGLHRALGVPEDEKIPKDKLNKAANSKDSHLKHMAQAAKNASEAKVNERDGDPCDCGSGEPGYWENDARGIPLCRCCNACRKEKLSGYRPDVLTDGGYYADEPIEMDESKTKTPLDLRSFITAVREDAGKREMPPVDVDGSTSMWHPGADDPPDANTDDEPVGEASRKKPLFKSATPEQIAGRPDPGGEFKVGEIVTNLPDQVDFIMSFEGGDISAQDTLRLFSNLIATGQAWSLQGSYGRAAQSMIEGGWIGRDGKILKDPSDANESKAFAKVMEHCGQCAEDSVEKMDDAGKKSAARGAEVEQHMKDLKKEVGQNNIQQKVDATQTSAPTGEPNITEEPHEKMVLEEPKDDVSVEETADEEQKTVMAKEEDDEPEDGVLEKVNEMAGEAEHYNYLGTGRKTDRNNTEITWKFVGDSNESTGKFFTLGHFLMEKANQGQLEWYQVKGEDRVAMVEGAISL